MPATSFFEKGRRQSLIWLVKGNVRIRAKIRQRLQNTLVAGKLAIQIAKHLGAGRVVAAGRNKRVLETLPDLGADAIIPLNQPDQGLTAAFLEEARRGHFDIILDYLWGHPTEVLLAALTGHDLRSESTRSRL